MADRMGFKAGQPCSKNKDLMDIRMETIQKHFEVKMGLSDKPKVGGSELQMVVIFLHGTFLIQNSLRNNQTSCSCPKSNLVWIR
jgi:hypothetical protein